MSPKTYEAQNPPQTWNQEHPSQGKDSFSYEQYVLRVDRK
jgi:hypothetical protein